MRDNDPRSAAPALLSAALATPKTAPLVLGCSWDTALRAAPRLGVPVLRIARKTPAIEVGAFVAALRREAEEGSGARGVSLFVAPQKKEGDEPEPSDPAAVVEFAREQLRRRRAAG